MDHSKHLSPERMQALLEGELPSRERARVEEHLETCVRCSEELESWRVLFDDLGALPSLELVGGPRAGFADRVMAGVRRPEPVPLAARIRTRLAAPFASLLGTAPVRHLDASLLQEYLEGLVPARRLGRVEAHLESCGPCSVELHQWQSVFGQLAALERFQPRVGFREPVMSAVRAHGPVAAAAAHPAWRRVPTHSLAWALGWSLGWVKRFVPRTRRAWAAISGVALTPAVVFGLLVYAVFSHPTLTPQALVSFGVWQATELAAWAWNVSLAFGTGALDALGVGPLVRPLVDALLAAPLAAAAGVLAYTVVFVLAVRFLHKNVLRNRSLSARYARASIS